MAIVISLLIFFFGSIKDCNSEKEKKIAEYNSNAMKYRPFIILEKLPDITELFYELDSSWLDSVAGIHSIRNINDLPRSSAIKGIRINTKLSLINNGNYPTRVIAFVITDTLTTYPTFKNWYKRKINTSNVTTDEFYDNIYLGVKGKYQYEVNDYKINYSTDSTFVLHAIISYENDLGALFYSYYTVKYQLKIRELYLNYEQIKKAQIYPYLRIAIKGASTKILSTDYDFGFYNYDESKEINQLLSDESKIIERRFTPPFEIKK